jgi:ketosteroid isomerase-like protein
MSKQFILSKENENLIKEYLDIAVNASEDFERFLNILTDDCVYRITPPGRVFRGKGQLRAFVRKAMGSRTHNTESKIKIRNWFTDGENLCVEYFHGALATRFHFKIRENVCFVFHMRNGKFDKLHEYVDTSGSMLVGFGLKMLPLISKGESSKPTGKED